MTVPESEREEIHHRQIDLRFYRRKDGLYEVEGRLYDKKTHPFRRLMAPADTPAGAPIHDITVRLVIDETMLVLDAMVAMDATPFPLCRGVSETVAPLKGLRMSGGWNKKVRELLGGAASCTHVVELLGPMATTAYQGLSPQRLAHINDPDKEAQRQAKVDSCYTYAGDREVVAQLWPHLSRGAKVEAGR